MKRYLFPIFLFGTSLSFAQDFTIKRVEAAGDNFNLYYDLVDTVSTRTYTVSLYSSKDNFITRLGKVSGDVGLEVRPGRNHKITWSAKEELGATFKGKVSIEVRGRLYIPFVRLEGLNNSYKRATEIPVTWTGGTQQNILNFDLYKGDEKIYPFSNIANVGQTTLIIPTTVRPGSDYYFRVTDSRNKDQVVITKTFQVKRKFPLLLKAAVPVLVIGAAVALLPKSASGGSGNEATSIPDAPSPTTIHP